MKNIGDINDEPAPLASNVQYTIKIYLGISPDRNFELIDKSGKWEDMQDLYHQIVANRWLRDELLAAVAMGHLDLDPNWEQNNYTIQMLDENYDELYRTTMFRPLM